MTTEVVSGFSCFCGSNSFKKFGFLRNGRQRISCWNCGSTKAIGPRPPYKQQERERAKEVLLKGESVRAAMAASGLAKMTICKLRDEIKDALPDKCKCGERLGHHGWCSYRYANSPARQAFMATLIPKAAPCHSLRPGAFFLGFLTGTSLHSQMISRQRHCESKACPFPAIYFDEDSHLCRYHANFFIYSLSMTDSRLGWEDLHDSEDQEATLSIVQPWNDPIIFEHKGKRIYDQPEARA